MTEGWRWFHYVIWGLLVGAVIGVVMGCKTPTGPEPPALEHPNEILMAELLRCHADRHGLPAPELWFWETRRWFTNEEGKLVYAACGAWPGQDYVECERTWVREAAKYELEAAAAHEVCHLAGSWAEPPEPCLSQARGRCL